MGSLKKNVYFKYHQFGFWLIGNKPSKTVIRVFAVKRTGQHAILNWLMQQWQGSISFHNNVPAGRPILSSHNHETRLRLPIKNPLLLYNHEDVPIKYAMEFDSYYEKTLRGYTKKIDVIILRDPFNCFASRIKANWEWDNLFVENETIRQNVINTWKEHAKEFISDVNPLQNKVLINYNRWILDVEYRRSIASDLDLQFTDSGFDHTPHYGLGSSFDGLSGTNNKNKLQERWREFEFDELYNSIFEDKELLELSHAVFDFVPAKFR